MNHLANGQTVGRYRIERLLGAGAMGEVYLAEDPHIGRQLAIKTVRLVGPPQEIEERKKRLLREARAAGRLLHPNVVTLFDAGEVGGVLYLAFEYVEGSDLAARVLSSPPLTLAEVLGIVRQSAEALHYAHQQGIVHRDIKPSNILLDPLGRVKVADFGIAKMAGQATELTQAGSVIGSPQYLSPEQIRGEELDARSDLFSLGVVLYELLSGKRPFSGETITSLVYQILHKEPPPVSELRHGVPSRLADLLDRMLAKAPDERIANAGLVAAEVAAIERELPDETLMEPAAGDPVRQAPTRILPPRETLPVNPAPPALPPLPPLPPPVAAMPPPPASAPRPQVQTAAARKPWLLPLAAGLALGFLALAALGFGAWKLGLGKLFHQDKPEEVAATGTEALPGQATETIPAPAPAVQPSAPPGKPATSAPIVPTPPSLQPRPSIPEAPPGKMPAPSPAPVQTQQEERRPEPVPAPAPREEAPEPAPEPKKEERYDRRMQSGLEIAFRITPPDAYVLVDGTNIGRSDEWSGLKGERTYTLPGAGEYLIKLRRSGLQEQRILVDARATAGTTQLTARLGSLPSAGVETRDLARTYRVREGIVLRVDPAEATVSVDGQPMGSAKNFSSRFGRSQEWLQLKPGLHRITLAAPGYQSTELAVDVSGGAETDRQRIEIKLTPGG